MPPRQLAAKDERHSTEAIASSASSSEKPVKRKAVSSACVPCRRRKSKCDGGLPSCSTCTAVYRTPCNYDSEPEQRRKPALRKNTPVLTSQSRPTTTSSDVIFHSLRTLPEHEAVSLLHHVRRQERLDDLALHIARRNSVGQESSGRSHDSDMTSPNRLSPTNSFPRDNPQTPSLTGSPMASTERLWTEPTALAPSRPPPESWFRTPQDPDFVEKLFNVYFSWHHPYHTTFSGPHFISDFQKGHTKYCNSLLVYAVLSLAVNYIDLSDSTMTAAQLTATGDLYFNEAQYLLNSSMESSLLTVQALTVMTLREASCGRPKSSYKLLGMAVRMAVDMNLHLQTRADPEHGLHQLDIETQKLTFWSLYNLEIMNALVRGKVSLLPSYAISVEKPSNADNLNSIIYQPYEDVNQAVEPAAQHAMHCILFTTKCAELCQLVNDTNLALYAPQEHITTQRLQSAHARYQSWYHSLPEVFLLQNTMMPQVVLLHIFYFKSLLHLFIPFFRLDMREAGLDPHGICTYCANEISSLVDRVRNVYGIQHVCVAVIGSITSAGAIHLLNTPDPTSVLRFSQAVADLQTLSVNHRMAAKCIDSLRGVACTWSIPLPENTGVPTMTAEEHLEREVDLGMYQVQASLGEDLKTRTISPAAGYRDRFDSASTFQSFPPQFQSHSSVVPHPAMDSMSGMMWPSIQPHGVQSTAAGAMHVLPEGEASIYPDYPPQT